MTAPTFRIVLHKFLVTLKFQLQSQTAFIYDEITLNDNNSLHRNLSYGRHLKL
jgi:hypothetical protein